MEIFSKIKHISIMAIKRVLIYLALSVWGWSVCFDQINSIRNEVYGIGNYLNIKACSGMLMILNGYLRISGSSTVTVASVTTTP